MHFHRIASVAYLARGSFIVGGRIRARELKVRDGWGVWAEWKGRELILATMKGKTERQDTELKVNVNNFLYAYLSL